jgi:ribosome-binding factor A
MSRRTERVNELLRHEVSELLGRELKDPRLGTGLLTVTEVDVSPDLRNATVYVSHLGEERERRDVLKALTSAAPFLHRELLRRLDMRRVPELRFRFDPSIERGARLSDLIHAVADEGEAEKPGGA